MNPLTPLALIIVMITAPIHYALEYPIWGAIALLLIIAAVMLFYRRSAERRAVRKLRKREQKIALYREAIRRESARDVA